MTPNKNHSEKHLAEVVHGLTQHLERIDYHVSTDDQSAAWHELNKLLAYLQREMAWQPPTDIS